MTNSINEIEGNDVLLIIGSNATEAHPIIGNKMKQAAARGAKLIVVDPRRTELAEHAHLWLQLKPGTDNALINGCCTSSSATAGTPRSTSRSAARASTISGRRSRTTRRSALREITGVPADLHPSRRPSSTRRPPKAGIFYTLGITEHTVGTDNVHEPRQPRHGHRPHRRRSTPASTPCAARTTCRAPATWARCPTRSPATQRQRRGRPGAVLRGLRRRPCRRRWACASPRCSTWPCTASSRPCTSWARTRCSPTPTPTTCARRSRASTSSSCRTSS